MCIRDSIGTIHTEDKNNNQFMRQFEQDRKAALAGKYNLSLIHI